MNYYFQNYFPGQAALFCDWWGTVLRQRNNIGQNEIDASVSKSESKVNNIVGMIFNAISVIKGTLFFSILDVIKGPQRTQADNGLTSSLSKINKKIKEFEKEIENLSTQINQLTTDNFILQTKIMHYKANPLPTM